MPTILSRPPKVLRVERHALGPRCHLLGRRLHEWHAGVVVLAGALIAALAGALSGWPLAAPVTVGAWLVVKDWHDLFPATRDSTTWSLGIHRPLAPLRPRPRGDWLPTAAAIVTGAVGAVNVASALTPELPGRLQLLLSAEPAQTALVAHAAAMPVGVALVLTALSLARRRRRALVLAVVLLAALAVLNLLKGLDVEEALLSAGLAAMLVRHRTAFDVAHDQTTWPSTARRVALIGVLAAGGALAAVVAGGPWAQPGLSPGSAVRDAIALLAGAQGPVVFAGPAAWLPLGIGLVGVVAVAAIAWTLFRPLAITRRRTSQATVGGLIRKHGRDTLSYFKLRADLSDVVAPDRRAFLSFRVERGVMLVAGDPVGPPEAIPGLIGDTCRLADRHGLKLAVLGASESLVAVGREAGLRSLYIGEEAIVDTSRFSLEGRSMRKVRQSVTRLTRAGYLASLVDHSELTAAELDELDAISCKWRAGVPERGFSMALDTIRGEHLADSRVLVARDADSVIRGFLHVVPAGQTGGSLSAMRRDPATPNGLTEFMVVRAIELLCERDVRELSLNFAAFARYSHAPASRAEALAGKALGLANPYFQLESLRSFNAKFHPRWQPRYLLFDGPLALPRTAVAALTAEGFVPRLRMPSPSG